MARNFNGKQLKNLINEHTEILSGLENSFSDVLMYKSRIKEAAEKYAASEAREILDIVSVTELSRMASGLRIKLLCANGYNTLGDIARASVRQIAAISGISDEGAHIIKNLVSQIELSNRANIRIRLSSDNKTFEASELILNIYLYRQLADHFAQCQKLYMQYGDLIKSRLNDLYPAQNIVKWLFTSSEKKNRAEAAYTFLDDFLSSEYSRIAHENLYTISLILDKSDLTKAWQDFAANSADYFALLEEIAPGMLGSDDLTYGLAPDIAENVINQDLALEGLKCRLRKYQEFGVKYILHQKKVLLGDEMGLGKTVQAIAAMVALRNTGEGKFIVICPASVLPNWCREISKHSNLPVYKLHGSRKHEEIEKWKEKGGVAVTTFETCSFMAPGTEDLYSMVIVDEAHYIKNYDSRRSFNVRNICRHTDRILFMTGTPIENKLEEMISLIGVLRPDIADMLCKSGQMLTSTLFKVQAAPVYYRRKREDVLTELPELIENEQWCEMCSVEREIYENDVLNSHIQHVRRLSWNVPDIAYSSKAAKLVEIVEEAKEEGRKVLVFSFFLDTLSSIKNLLGNVCMEAVTGSISPNRRQQIINDFDNSPAGSVLPAQITSGGTGLNIQSASVVVICEPQFKPSIENQAIARAYRMGQTRNVIVHRLLCEDTIDERITEILEGKQQIFDEYADTSVAAQSSEISDKIFSGIMELERKRVSEKHTNEE